MVNLYKYLKDEVFLKKLDSLHIRENIIKITVLDWEENPINDIEGLVSSGNININGDSAIRRTAQLSLFIPSSEVDYTNAASLISINKKIKLEIGIKNTLNKYTDYDILWFPLGLYVVSSVSIS